MGKKKDIPRPPRPTCFNCLLGRREGARLVWCKALEQHVVGSQPCDEHIRRREPCPM